MRASNRQPLVGNVRCCVGTITDETRVWAEGMDDWVAYGECKERFRMGTEEAVSWDDGILYASLHSSTSTAMQTQAHFPRYRASRPMDDTLGLQHLLSGCSYSSVMPD